MFDNAKFLSLHKILLHNKNKQDIAERSNEVEKYACPHCTLQFDQFDEFKQHLVDIHEDPRHFCNFCSKSFKLRGSLLVHQRVIHQYPVVQLSEDMNDFNQQEASPSQAMSGIFASEDEVLKQPVKGNSDFK